LIVVFSPFPRGILSVSSSGAGAVIGRLDKSGDTSGLANGGTYEEIPEIGVLSPEIFEHGVTETSRKKSTTIGLTQPAREPIIRHGLSVLPLGRHW
jgi:hypothetical protein